MFLKIGEVMTGTVSVIRFALEGIDFLLGLHRDGLGAILEQHGGFKTLCVMYSTSLPCDIMQTPFWTSPPLRFRSVQFSSISIDNSFLISCLHNLDFHVCFFSWLEVLGAVLIQ